jgi:alpha-galactosidase
MKSITLLPLFFCAASLSLAGVVSPNTHLNAREEQIVAAVLPAAPQFHNAAVVGIRPGTAFLLALAVSGERPLTYTVKNLPSGLSLDPQTGIITGKLKKAGEYVFTAAAKNTAGQAQAEIKIVAGDQLALTPPLGWNSYDAYGDSVTEAETLANAEWLRDHLQSLGWDTVVVDFRWYDSLADGQRVQDPEGVQIDGFGRCVPATNRFPSAVNGAGFKPLADKLHAMGLKFGIHIMRGIPRAAVEHNLPVAGSQFTANQVPLPESDTNRTCVWNRDMYGVDATQPAGQAWYESLAQQYAAWGVDYIKCDDIANLQRGKFYDADEIAVLSEALKHSGHSIVLSLSPGATPVNAGPHVARYANLWRISPDFWDNWRSLNHNFELFAGWTGDTGPGHWPDGDMIPFGHVCQRNCDVRPDRWTRFNRNEQVTLMSLWALNSAPLMLGMNLLDNDAWTTALISNPEVLAVDQDALGHAAQRRFGPPHEAEVWTKPLADGTLAVGFFNRTDRAVKVNYEWRNLGYGSAPQVRDLWVHQDLGQQAAYTGEIPAHGAVLLKLVK